MVNNPFEERSELSDYQLSFFDNVDRVKSSLVQYEDDIERIESLQKRSLTETREAEVEILHRRIDEKRNHNRALAYELKSRIKELESQSLNDETRMAHCCNAKQHFMNLLQKFQAGEASFRQKYYDVTVRQYKIIYPNASNVQIKEFMENDYDGQVFSQALQINRLGEAQAVVNEVHMRHLEIQKIERTITELAELFHDMELMVANQDFKVQQVESNIYATQTHIEKGMDSQKVAIRKTNAWRKKKRCSVLFLLIVAIALALSLGIYFGSKH